MRVIAKFEIFRYLLIKMVWKQQGKIQKVVLRSNITSTFKLWSFYLNSLQNSCSYDDLVTIRKRDWNSIIIELNQSNIRWHKFRPINSLDTAKCWVDSLEMRASANTNNLRAYIVRRQINKLFLMCANILVWNQK